MVGNFRYSVVQQLQLSVVNDYFLKSNRSNKMKWYLCDIPLNSNLCGLYMFSCSPHIMAHNFSTLCSCSVSMLVCTLYVLFFRGITSCFLVFNNIWSGPSTCQKALSTCLYLRILWFNVVVMFYSIFRWIIAMQNRFLWYVQRTVGSGGGLRRKIGQHVHTACIWKAFIWMRVGAFI